MRLFVGRPFVGRPLVLLLVVGAIAGCEQDIMAPTASKELAAEIEPFQPWDIHREWWDEVGECTGEYRDIATTRWYVVPGESWELPDGRIVNGLYYPDGRMYFAEAELESEDVIKHESTHAHIEPTREDDPRFYDCSGVGHGDDLSFNLDG